MTERPRKIVLYDLVLDLHALRISDAMIGRLLHLDRTQVRRILTDMEQKSRWFDLEDIRDSLPKELRDACNKYTTNVELKSGKKIRHCPTMQITAHSARPKET